MYKVMLVDDDYPVLELLTKTIDWKSLGFEVMSTHENGVSALKKAEETMPDVLISDIGMPKMNGIELTRKMKSINESLQVALLSCHTEFNYAREALKLQVSDYLVKDTFELEELYELLEKFKIQLDTMLNNKQKEQKLQHILHKNIEKEKTAFIKRLINNGYYKKEAEWESDRKKFGLLADKGYIVTLLSIHHHPLDLFPEETLYFAVSNIVGELLGRLNPSAVHFLNHSNKVFIFFPRDLGYQRNALSNAKETLKMIQLSIDKGLNMHSSSIIGETSESLLDYQNTVNRLLNNHQQLFYMLPRTVSSIKECVKNTEELFAKYDEAATEMRMIVLNKKVERISNFIHKWTIYIMENQFPPEIVKDWFWKLLLDLNVKLQALQYFSGEYSFESKHKEIFLMEYMYQLKDWLKHYFEKIIHYHETIDQTKRKEIIEAFKFVAMNLERKITLDEISSYLFLNPSYFSRLFKKEVGETFVEYVTRMKINRAKELLEQTDESVGKICERLGYDNQSYFIKLFKTYAGITPMEYRSGKVG
ncbi:DNA-binding response regulator [Niallia circulans]|uniref:response regulator transcription factor n=1 Tax=Niallia circulans TaxID=1397 RepID=UPI00201E462C|nr:helix-turn-helix domain-containing protein [Niallia circulans]UQZ73788.1 DNA-binding response regulator [Niallia circulans]